ncbi:MAG TPA: GFA family protein [Solirubrobacterales bacterium]|nr:GFA family protein [Solirubrobacterales bacterium]
MCGGVRYELSEPLLGALYCHCKRCQHRTGTGYSVNALTAPGSYRTVAGEELLGSYDPGDGGWVKSFCTRCGSHVFTTNPEDPEMVGIRMGTLDEDPGVRPGLHQFTTYAPAWAPVPDDGLPRFPERFAPGASPLDQ